MTLIELGRSAHFARTAPAIVDFANIFERNVMSGIEGARPVLHISLADTRDCRDTTASTRLARPSYLGLVHDPPRVLGLAGWRPKSLRASYVRWYATSTWERRRAMRDLRFIAEDLAA